MKKFRDLKTGGKLLGGFFVTTIQQVARGNAQQSESGNNTSTSVEQMAHAIDGMAKGAQEQAAAVRLASVITQQIASSVQQVAANAQAVTRDSAEAAREGVKTVHATIQGIESIKSKVGMSAKKVQEMGTRSEAAEKMNAAVNELTGVSDRGDQSQCTVKQAHVAYD